MLIPKSILIIGAGLGIGGNWVDYVPMLLCLAAAAGGGYLYVCANRRKTK